MPWRRVFIWTAIPHSCGTESAIHVFWGKRSGCIRRKDDWYRIVTAYLQLSVHGARCAGYLEVDEPVHAELVQGIVEVREVGQQAGV